MFNNTLFIVLILVGAFVLKERSAVADESHPVVSSTHSLPATTETNDQQAAGFSKVDKKATPTTSISLTNERSVPTETVTNQYLVSNTALLREKKAAEYQSKLDLAKSLRAEREYEQAEKHLRGLIEGGVPPELQRVAMLELAYVAQDSRQFAMAQQIYSEYVRQFSQDPSVPEVILRQGLLYRDMGVYNLALSKFYAVMSSSLSLNLDQMEYYQKLVLKAQTEIAETYYLQGKYQDAADFFGRLLKMESSALNKALCHFKVIRSLGYLGKNSELVVQAELFISKYEESQDIPEVRFLLADALKKLGRNNDAMKQVLALLEAESSKAASNPELWSYWQQRTGNEIANQLYKEGDYLNALEIYLSLARLNTTPQWQLPVYYQAALVYEHLKQPQKAIETLDMIISRQSEVSSNAPPSLIALFDMAKWRRQYVQWEQGAHASNTNLLSN